MERVNFVAYKRQRNQIILLCVVGYTISYLCRTNLSLALNDLIQLLSINKSQAGLITTMHFWAYAGGQLLSGFLCTKINPKYVAAFGMLFTAICNGCIGFSSNYALVVLLWMLNGLALAFFWPPILQISINWVSPKEYTLVSILLNLPTTVGYLISWSTLGVAHNFINWRWLFFIPAIISFAFLFVWLFKIQAHAPKQYDSYRAVSPPAHEKHSRTKKASTTLLKSFLSVNFVCFAIVVAIQGSIKESINLWAPTLIADLPAQKFSLLTSAFTSLIPVFSTIGLLVTGWLLRHFSSQCNTPMVYLLLVGFIASVSMTLFNSNALFVVVCLGILLAVVYGVNTILTTLLPLQFSKNENSALLSSVFNFLSYTGAALGGTISGAVCDAWGWSSVYILWTILSTVSAIILIGYVIAEHLLHNLHPKTKV